MARTRISHLTNVDVSCARKQLQDLLNVGRHWSRTAMAFRAEIRPSRATNLIHQSADRVCANVVGRSDRRALTSPPSLRRTNGPATVVPK